MPLYYGEIKERLKFQKLLKRLEDGETLTDEQIEFVETRLCEFKDHKLWVGVNFKENGLQKLQTILRKNEKKNVES